MKPEILINSLQQAKTAFIVGYGLEGKSTEKFLKKYYPHLTIAIGDKSRDAHYLDMLSDYDLVIKSPGVSSSLIPVPYTTATNIFFAHCHNMTIGITGTKGKSTTASLLHDLFQRAKKKSYLAGNIGIPMLDLLLNNLDKDAAIILELSSYQLADIQFSPHISCILNIYEELHNHPNFESYKKAKFMIAQNAKSEDYLIYNPHIPDLNMLLESTQAKKIALQTVNDRNNYPTYLADNTLSAIQAIAEICDISTDMVNKTCIDYKPLPHRLQNVGVFNDIIFINDSAANHPEATLHALNVIDAIGTLIVGGQNRQFQFHNVIKKCAEKDIKYLVLFPDTQEIIMNEMKNFPHYLPQIFKVNSMSDAVSIAFSHTPKGMVCLLSPGAPSYLMFDNFQARAEAYINEIHAYAQKKKT